MGFIDYNIATYSLFRVFSSEEIIEHPPSMLSPEHQSDGTSSDEKARDVIMKAFSGEIKTFEWDHKRLDDSKIWL